MTDDEIAAVRNRVMEHTSRTIAHDGVTGCTLSAVAKSAGCSLGMIQHHFGTRDELVLSSIRYRSDLAIREWERLASAGYDPVVTLRALLTFAVEGDESFEDAWGFWIQAYAAALRDDTVRDVIVEALASWKRLFVETVARVCAAVPAVRDRDPTRLASYIIAAVDGFAMETLGRFYGSDAASMQADLCGMTELLLGLPTGALRTPSARTADALHR